MVVDQSQARLEVRGDTTIFSNPIYGATIHLPGKWGHVKQKNAGLGQAARFCFLQNEDSGDTVLVTRGLMLTPEDPRKASYDFLSIVWQEDKIAIEGEQPVLVAGRRGHLLWIVAKEPNKRSRQGVLVVPDTFAMYTVILTNRDPSETHWQAAKEWLPKALELN